MSDQGVLIEESERAAVARNPFAHALVPTFLVNRNKARAGIIKVAVSACQPFVFKLKRKQERFCYTTSWQKCTHEYNLARSIYLYLENSSVSVNNLD